MGSVHASKINNMEKRGGKGKSLPHMTTSYCQLLAFIKEKFCMLMEKRKGECILYTQVFSVHTYKPTKEFHQKLYIL
jgi:hypothetical protein